MHIPLKESSEGENRAKAVERLARRAEVAALDLISPNHDAGCDLLFIDVALIYP